MQNPWAKLATQWSSQPMVFPKIYPCDDKIVRQINTPGGILLDLWPEPFMGNPDADIYLLNGNPGCANYTLELSFAKDPTFADAMVQNLQHLYNSQNFVYLDSFNINVNNKNIDHPGCKWWAQRTKTFRKKSTKTFFNIDFFPYHSKSLKGIPVDDTQKYLPSYKYSNDLIQQAMKDGKIIIIMRLRDAWLKRIPALATYQNLYFLCSSQNISVTPNNVCSYSEYQNLKTRSWNAII